MNIEVEHCLEIPNVITPNSDGINDTSHIGKVVNFPDARLSVYSRWAAKVFDSQSYLNEWVPIEMAPGVYYYIWTECFPELRGDLNILKN